MLDNVQQATWVCCYAGRQIYSQLHFAISPYPADGILSAFVVIFSFSIGCGSGLDIIKYPTIGNTCPSTATLLDILLTSADRQNKMIETIAKWTVILFGLFFICIGFLMLIKPQKAIEILRKAGSTNFINYAEITIRIIPAVGLILSADYSKYPDIFKVFGWFMLLTSLVLYFVPRQLHHKFSVKAAGILKPLYFQLISPFAFLIGTLLIYCVI